MGIDALIEIDFDSGTRYYSRNGVRAPHAFYRPLISSFGGMSRDIPVVPSDYRAAQVKMTFSNASGEFSRLRDSESWRNRPLRVRLGDPDVGWQDFTVAFVGRISNWSIDKETCSIDAVDAIQSRLGHPLDFVIDGGFYHRLPDETPRALAPLVIGEVTAPLGAVPAYLVEPSVEIVPFRYIACQGVAKSIDEVYAYGALVDPGDYSITNGLGPTGGAVTFIDFDSDQRVVGDATEPHVSWNGSGQTDDGTSGGNAINNGAEQLERVLLLNGFAADEIDSTKVAAAADTLDQKQIRGAFVAVERGITVGDAVRLFAENYNLQIFATNDGKVGITAPDPTIDEDAELPELTAIHDIVAGSFAVAGPQEVASTLVASYQYNWYSGEFLSTSLQTNPQQIGALGEDVATNSEHPFIRGSASMREVAAIKMFFMREQRQIVTATTTAHWHKDLDIGDAVRITHFAGIGQSGYASRIFRVVAIGLEEAGAALATKLTLVDLDAEPFFFVPQADFAQPMFGISDYFGQFSVERGRLRMGA